MLWWGSPNVPALLGDPGRAHHPREQPLISGQQDPQGALPDAGLTVAPAPMTALLPVAPQLSREVRLPSLCMNVPSAGRMPGPVGWRGETWMAGLASRRGREGRRNT